MASSRAPYILAFLADAAIVKGTAVKMGTDSKHVAKSTAETDNSVGICQNDATAAEDPVEIAMPGGGAKALAGGTIAAGDRLSATTDGSLIKVSAGSKQIVAIAMESAVVGDIFAVDVVRSDSALAQS